MQNKIKDLLKEAMKTGDEVGKMTYRGLLSAFMVYLTSNNKKPQDPISDEEIMQVIRKEIKKRDDSINQYTNAGRPELAEGEAKEKELLMKFLPQQLSYEEVVTRVKTILSTQNSLDHKVRGKYVGLCVKELKDVANGDDIKKAVESILQANNNK
jgi:uncharacterized protein YqeY